MGTDHSIQPAMNTPVLLLALVAVVAAQTNFVARGTQTIPKFVSRGTCPNIDSGSLLSRQAPNFHKYAGTWYEIAITENPNQSLKQCVRNQFIFDGSRFAIQTTGLDASGIPAKRSGFIRQVNPADNYLSADYEGAYVTPYHILDTDYDNYACVYMCLGVGDSHHADFGIVYSRTPSLDSENMWRCMAAFNYVGIQAYRFQNTPQGGACARF